MTEVKRIKGVLSPVVTPFKADHSPDAERFVRQCRWLISQNVRTGGFGTNSARRIRCRSTNASGCSRRSSRQASIPPRLMPGTGCCALTDSVKLTAHAVSWAAAAC